MFYNARWYDSSLSRFAQADSIIPESTQGVQAWDRYAYANNSPIINSDPSGHSVPCWAACSVWNSFKNWWTGKDVGYTGSQGLYLGHGPRQLIGKWLGYDKNDNASNMKQLITRGLLQYEHTNLTGGLLEDIKNDPDAKSVKQETMGILKTDPRFGKEDFQKNNLDKPGNIHLGQGTGDWTSLAGLVGKLEAAQNSTTWSMRNAEYTYSASVSQEKNVQVTFTAYDTLNLRYQKGRSFGYNAYVLFLGSYYHDRFGGNDQMTTSATWTIEK